MTCQKKLKRRLKKFLLLSLLVCGGMNAWGMDDSYRAQDTLNTTPDQTSENNRSANSNDLEELVNSERKQLFNKDGDNWKKAFDCLLSGNCPHNLGYTFHNPSC